MKYHYFLIATLGLFFLLGVPRSIYVQEKSTISGDLQFAVRSSTDRPFLGERFELILGLKNTGAESRTVSASLRDNTGYTGIYVSRDGKNFGQYIRPGERSLEGGHQPVTLKPGEVVEFSTSVYVNEKPRMHALSPTVAERAAKTRILTDYVFPEAGDYFIKATHSVLLDGGQRVKIESAPVKLTVEEPTGEDLEVWRRIKDRGDIGFFIQEGWFRKAELDERRKLIHELELLVNRYPTSFIAKQIGQRLREFDVSQRKR